MIIKSKAKNMKNNNMKTDKAYVIEKKVKNMYNISIRL